MPQSKMCGYCYKSSLKCTCKRTAKKKAQYLQTWKIDQKRWNQVRLHWLANHPLCAECERQGIIKEAIVCDHIIPHKGDYDLMWSDLMWSDSNYQSLCIKCHNTKTARER